MKTILIDGSEITSRENAHAQLFAKLSFPDYYGGNLDALHDCLTGINEPTHIILEHCDDVLLSLGSYGAALLRVLNVSSTENDYLTVSFHFDTVAHTEDKPDIDRM